MSTWKFSTSDTPWSCAIDAAPTEDTKRHFWELAVPTLVANDTLPVLRPCVVVCHVRAPGHWGSPPGGPLGRPKGLLDALHDDRKTGPWYCNLPGRAPLTDDHPAHVRGLAVEVLPGEARTECQFGTDDSVAGELLASVPVDAAAPNDIWGTASEKAKIAAGRLAFSAAVQQAFLGHPGLVSRSPAALVVRHQPQRDEDNTWATWIAAACGVRSRSAGHWSHEAPLVGWAPTAVASIADPSLETHVRYEVWS